MEPSADWWRDQLIWALRWLAAEPVAAIEALRVSDGTGRVPVDEIALTLEDVWIQIPDQGLVSDSLRALLQEIDGAWEPLDDPGHEDGWTDAALATHPIWIEQRQRARMALAQLGAERDDIHLLGNV